MAHIDTLVEHVVALMRSQRHAIADVRVFEQVDPATRVFGLELSTRTRHALTNSVSLIQGEKLCSLTWGQLLSIEGLGVRSALEFALNMEKAQARTKTAQRNVLDNRKLSASTVRALQRNARHAWARGLTLNDPRLGSLARRDNRSVTRSIEDALDAAMQGHTSDAESLSNVVDAIRTIGEAIESEHIELQLRNLVVSLTSVSDDRLAALAARMGILGPRATLRASGDIAGMSGASLQQLQIALMEQVKRSRHLYLPAVDASEDVLKRASPLRLDDAARMISDRDISRGKVDVAVLVSEWLPVLGRRSLSLVHHVGTDWLIRPELGTAAQQLAVAGYFDAETDHDILKVAHWLCRSVGVASLRWVIEESILGDHGSSRGVRRVIRNSGKFVFLDRNWFWEPSVPTRQNHLEKTLRKVLAVSPRLAFDDAMEALERVYRQGRLPRLPPANVVIHFVTSHPSFDYDQGRIVAFVPLDMNTELAQAEQLLVEILSSVPGGVLDRQTLRRACSDRRMNSANFARYLSFSPILWQPAQNLWALRGHDIDQSVIQRLNAPPRRRRQTTIASRTPDGRLTVSWTIAGRESTTLTIPAAERHDFTDCDYRALDTEGGLAGTVHVDGRGASRGYTPFLHATNAAPGDRLVATFSLASRTVILDLERGADRQWVGDLSNCFLHEESWALRLYVDNDLSSGTAWDVPFPLADATGLGPGKHDIRWCEDSSVRLTITRDEGRCVGSSLEQVLMVLGAASRDRVFIELNTSWFRLVHRGPADLHADPLNELLASAGIGRGQAERGVWGALSRALGGSSGGGRYDVEKRLRERGDQVSLGLLHRARQVVARFPSKWPESWEFVAELDPDESRFAIHNRDGAIRVAVGTASKPTAVPDGAIVDGRGVVWVDETFESSIVSSLVGIDGVVLSGKEPGWVQWARAEHHARRASLSGTHWTLELHGENGWRVGKHLFSDLREALYVCPVASHYPILRDRNRYTRFPTSAFAFRRIVNNLVGDKIVTLRSDKTFGFVAAFGDVMRYGVGLADVVLR